MISLYHSALLTVATTHALRMHTCLPTPHLWENATPIWCEFYLHTHKNDSEFLLFLFFRVWVVSTLGMQLQSFINNKLSTKIFIGNIQWMLAINHVCVMQVQHILNERCVLMYRFVARRLHLLTAVKIAEWCKPSVMYYDSMRNYLHDPLIVKHLTHNSKLLKTTLKYKLEIGKIQAWP